MISGTKSSIMEVDKGKIMAEFIAEYTDEALEQYKALDEKKSR